MSRLSLSNEDGNEITPVKSSELGAVAWNELVAGDACAEAIKYNPSIGWKANVLANLGNVGGAVQHYANAFTAAILALWAGTRTEP